MALICPSGVDKKQLPAMFNICPIEYVTAYAAILNSENMNTKVIISDSTHPVIEHAKKPIILVLYVRSPHNVVFSSPNENIPLSSFFS